MSLDAKIQLAIGLSPIGAAAVSDDGIFQFCNGHLAKLLGRDRAQIEGRLTYQEITHPEDLEGDVEQHQMLIAGKIDRYEMEKRYFRLDGSVIWVKISVARIAEKGQTYCLVFITDLSSNKEMTALASLKAELHRAIASQEFVLWYQPIINLRTNKIAAYEALVRWEHHSGLRFPDFFLPTARHLSLEPKICRIVMRLICEQLQQWKQAGVHQGVAIAMNVEPSTFQLPAYEEMLQSEMAKCSVLPPQIWLELLEVQQIDDEIITQKGQWLLEQDFHVSLDDFGTDCSNLAAVTRYPLKALKLDRTLVMNINSDRKRQAAVRSTIGMAHSLGLEVIAEGVETESDRDWLLHNDCDYGQGYHFRKPCPASEL